MRRKEQINLRRGAGKREAARGAESWREEATAEEAAATSVRPIDARSQEGTVADAAGARRSGGGVRRRQGRSRSCRARGETRETAGGRWDCGRWRIVGREIVEVQRGARGVVSKFYYAFRLRRCCSRRQRLDPPGVDVICSELPSRWSGVRSVSRQVDVESVCVSGSRRGRFDYNKSCGRGSQQRRCAAVRPCVHFRRCLSWHAPAIITIEHPGNAWGDPPDGAHNECGQVPALQGSQPRVPQ